MTLDEWLDQVDAELGPPSACGRTGVADVIDASVVLCARSHRHHVVTSDPRDLADLDGTLPIVIV